MCGVVGVLHFDLNAPVDAAVLVRMRDIARHRGPDDAGLWTEGSVGLGHRRLSILDLEGGHQPMGNESKGIWLTYNGEIYNFYQLRWELEQKGHRFYTQGDTEVVLRAYEEYGADVASHLEGMFALAIWDSPLRRLFLSRDRFGIKPLYYSVMPWGVIFASEIRSILAHPRVSRELDWASLGLYLQMEYLPAPRTFFHDIFKLPAGHHLIVENGQVRTQAYWDLNNVKALERVEETEAIHTVDFLLQESVKSMLVSDVPLGIFLSGGLDSSAIVSAACHASNRRIQTFSLGVDDPNADETKYAEQVARHFGTDHQTLRMREQDVLDCVGKVLAHLDEPLADASMLPTFLLCQATRRHVTVALSGDGGDELFAGYATHKAYLLAQYYLSLPLGVRTFLSRTIPSLLPVSERHLSLDFKIRKFFGAVDCPPLTRNFLWWGAYDRSELNRVLRPEILRAAGPVDLESMGGNEHGLNGVLRWDLKFYLQDDLLPKVDRMSMAHSLEVRVPFLDTRLVEYVTSLPAHLKLRGLQSKHILRKVLADKIPSRILGRKKRGFDVPLGRWLNSELKDLVDGCLSPENLRKSGIFEATEVARLVAEHRQGKANYRQRLWPLIVFETWRRSVLA